MSPAPAVFDPFAAGATEVTPKFDPFATGATESTGPDWATRFATLQNPNRQTAADREAYARLAENTDNSKEDQARAVNMAYVQTKMPELAMEELDRDWPAVKLAYANTVLGWKQGDITDTAFAELVGKREEMGLKERWARSGPIARLRMMFGSHGYGDTQPEVGAVPIIGSEAAGTKGGLVTIPKAEGDSTLAGLMDASNKFVSSMTSFENVALGGATVGAGAVANLAAATRAAVAARVTQAAAVGTFTAVGAKDTVTAVQEAQIVMADPNSTDAQKADAMATAVLSAGMTALAAKGTYDFSVAAKAEAGALGKVAPKTAAKPAQEPGSVAAIAPEEPVFARPVEPDVVVSAAEPARVAAKAAEGEPSVAGAAPEPAPVRPDDLTDAVADAPDSAPIPEKAVPRFVANKGDPISIKNANVDAELRAMGLPEATRGEKVTFKGLLDQAAKQAEADPHVGQKLVASVRNNPRPLSAAEDVALTYEMNRLRLARDAAEQDLLDAVRNGDRDGEVTAQFNIAQTRQAFLEASEAATLAGTANAQGLALRRMMMKEDYSLAAMERRAAVANNGKPLAPEAIAEIKALHDKLAAAEKALEDYRKGIGLEKPPGSPADADSAANAGKSGAEPTPERLAELLDKRRAALEAEIKDLNRRIGENDLATQTSQKANRPGAAELETLLQERDGLRATLEAMRANAARIAELERSIAEKAAQLESGNLTAKAGGQVNRPSANAAVEILQLERDALNRQLAEARKEANKPTEAEKLQRQVEALDKRIAERQAKLEAGDVFSSPKEANRPLPQELETRQQELTRINKEMAELRRGPPKTPQQRANTRISERIVELERRLGEKDVSPRTPRREVQLDSEGNRLQAHAELLRLEFENMVERVKYENSTALSKAAQQGLGIYDAARLLMTTGEFSFLLRQGKVAALSRPIQTAKALPDTFRAFAADPVGAHAINLRVLNHPDAVRARAAKLHLADEGAKLSKQEEILVGKMLGEKIPVVGGLLQRFNNAATVFLNRVRFDMFQTMRKVGMTAAEEKQLAMFINEATGRGGLGPLEQAAVPLARVMFSPRYFASRIQLATGHSLWGGTWQTRRVIAQEYARTLVALGAYYSALYMALSAGGNDVEIGDDPRSSDFGKIKIGNSRLDPLAGISQVAVFGARTASGEKTTTRGRTVDIRGEGVPYGGDRWTDVAANFARSKLHPVPGTIANLFDGTDLAGQEATFGNQASNMVAPLTYQEIYQALEEQDLPEGVALSLLALLGEGLQTYDPKARKK